ncbi:prolipoprotein diacylglyceryl transferase [Micrococcus luteus]|uniref:prolipoprotein diacylglyceryl transferase n=1 Tax=Micrococcus luteus TaxID=1270 RepID=UPI001199E88B|nr:prolipoprotein diacylglyceryl transferase [Micrococcus luteus]MCV7612188.1 prolipoprotein diacylglyceryl transferase [Micrococcus luteus]TWH37828.1 prolipoprotein diacylglyceryl transferase [Micrococcus luteus J28]
MTAALAPLAAFPAPGWDGFQLGPVKIHAYALCIILGIVLALWLAERRWRARGGPEDRVLDIALWAIPFGFVGGRLYHVLSSPDRYFGPGFDGTGDPIQILYVWNGGLGIWGAIALGAVGAWIACRRYGVRLSAFADVVAPGILLAQAVGRWGNWFNQELFGGPTTAPWGLRVDADHPNFPAGLPADTLFHPTFLYESLWNLLGVAVLLLVDRRWRLRHGAMVWAYVAWYTAGRVWIEMLRIDDAEMVTLFGVTQRLNVWTSILVLVVGVAMLVLVLVRHGAAAAGPRSDDDVWLPGRAPQPVADAAHGGDRAVDPGAADETRPTAGERG